MIIADFDQTICRLAVDWGALRRRLGIERLGVLWALDDPDRWAMVTAAEVAAAGASVPIDVVARKLAACDGFAVMTNNSADAVATFLERFPLLEARCRLVVAREQLQGPKEGPELFAAAFARCLDALGTDAPDAVTYLGDQHYELVLAAGCGARVLQVTTDGSLAPFDGSRSSGPRGTA